MSCFAICGQWIAAKRRWLERIRMMGRYRPVGRPGWLAVAQLLDGAVEQRTVLEAPAVLEAGRGTGGAVERAQALSVDDVGETERAEDSVDVVEGDVLLVKNVVVTDGVEQAWQRHRVGCQRFIVLYARRRAAAGGPHIQRVGRVSAQRGAPRRRVKRVPTRRESEVELELIGDASTMATRNRIRAPFQGLCRGVEKMGAPAPHTGKKALATPPRNFDGAAITVFKVFDRRWGSRTEHSTLLTRALEMP